MKRLIALALACVTLVAIAIMIRTSPGALVTVEIKFHHTLDLSPLLKKEK